jgi:hypothetical protein
MTLYRIYHLNLRLTLDQLVLVRIQVRQLPKTAYSQLLFATS